MKSLPLGFEEAGLGGVLDEVLAFGRLLERRNQLFLREGRREAECDGKLVEFGAERAELVLNGTEAGLARSTHRFRHQFGKPCGEEGIDLGAAVPEDAVDAEVELRQIEFEDVLADEAEESVAVAHAALARGTVNRLVPFG